MALWYVPLSVGATFKYDATHTVLQFYWNIQYRLWSMCSQFSFTDKCAVNAIFKPITFKPVSKVYLETLLSVKQTSE